MKFLGQKNTLQTALQTISGAVTSSSTLPILENILLETTDDGLNLVATDLEITITTSADVKVQAEGSCTVPARKFQKLIQELPAGDTVVEFDLNEDEERVVITVGDTNSRFELPVLPEDEFPSFPVVEDGFSFRFDSDRLEYVLKNSQFAAATDTTRSYLCGIYFDLDHEGATVVATDAHRLALHETKFSGEQYDDKDRSLLLPVKGARELIKIIPSGEQITIKSDGNLVEFQLGGSKLISRLIDEDFPNYNQVIPQEYKQRVTVNRKRFYDAVRRVSLLSDQKTRRLLVELKPGKLQIKAEASETGSGEEEVEVDYTGDEQTIAFNGDYLADVLDHIDDKEVYFDLISPDSPGTFRPIQDNDYLFIIMPLRLS
ncbi:MAG: DNA polymerase III subunit beta [bacterium]